MNIKSMQKKSCLEPFQNGGIIKKVISYFLKHLVIFYKFVDPFALRVRGHKGVQTKSKFFVFILISKSSSKTLENYLMLVL